MDRNPSSAKRPASAQGIICRYRLDFMQSGSQHYYVWRLHPHGDGEHRRTALLIDLNHVYIPNHEVEKMITDFVIPPADIACIAFANCHTHNHQDIKRRLKAGSIELFSKSAFFTDMEQAEQWLKAQSG